MVTKESLKARAYDIVTAIAQLQNELQHINTALTNWKDPEVAESVKPMSKEETLEKMGIKPKK
jgi:hypothetical protein